MARQRLEDALASAQDSAPAQETEPADPATPEAAPAHTPMGIAQDTVAAREAMVARLEETGVLRPGPVRDALLSIRREVLMPQAYVRRDLPGEAPPRWDLLDWAEPADRDELVTLLYGGESVLVQHAGERVLGRVQGPRSGRAITRRRTSKPDGARGCKTCNNDSRRRAMYGTEPEDFLRMLEDQGNCCAVCGVGFADDNRSQVDHDHSCCPGKKSCGECVRGLLCNSCNNGLGRFKDSVNHLRAAVSYLESFQ
ncbi:endonuclease VII domain-containing protein [Streptomyces sp. NPDC050997]|uniref:endonuclease VII domain-containing protein n=1 Tax=Streptomyces sp. NPDC050997 TaxID=3155519 RepID=UPI003433DDE0